MSATDIQGAGIGLRSAHIEQILSEQPPLRWVELLTDNHLASGGLVRAHLDAVRSLYPLTLHCVSMSLGSTDPLDWDYIGRIKQLATDFEVSWISEHICFTSAGHHHSHDLLPLPYTEEALNNLVDRVVQVQEFLGRRLLMENATSYIRFSHSTLTEAEFINELVVRADCELLFDVNNAYVNQTNHDADAMELIRQLPLEKVKEVHLAGFESHDDFLLDAHNNPVADDVWALYRHLLQLKPNIATQIEWDNQIPELSVLIAEADKAQRIIDEVNGISG